MTKLIKKLSEAKTVFFISLIYSVFITIAFLTPLKGTANFKFFIPPDKLIHLSFYTILAFIWNYYFSISKNNIKINQLITVVILACLIYGIIIEVIQELWVPTRGADVFDVLANLTGAILGSILFLNVKKRIKS